MEQFFFSFFFFGTPVTNYRYQASPSKGMYSEYQQTGYFRQEEKKKKSFPKDIPFLLYLRVPRLQGSQQR